MRIQYWGTAAAEAYPAMFCTCEACRRAREQGGKNIRTRTSALIDQSVMIDFSPDTNYNRFIKANFTRNTACGTDMT